LVTLVAKGWSKKSERVAFCVGFVYISVFPVSVVQYEELAVGYVGCEVLNRSNRVAFCWGFSSCVSIALGGYVWSWW